VTWPLLVKMCDASTKGSIRQWCEIILLTMLSGYDVFNSVIKWHPSSIWDPATIRDPASIRSFTACGKFPRGEPRNL